MIFLFFTILEIIAGLDEVSTATHGGAAAMNAR
jgi:hypothetical protein